MEKITRKQIQSYIIDYCKKKIPNFIIKSKMMTCPKCGQLSANIFPENSNKLHCYSPKCGNLGDIFDICRFIEFENNKDVDDEFIAKQLIEEFKIQTDDKVEKLFAQYSEWQWSLFPVAKDDKIPIQKQWTSKVHKDLREWKQWYDNGSNLGMRTGEVSNVTVIDVDLISKEESEVWQKGTALKTIEEIKFKKEKNLEKLKSFKIFNDTLMQDSGWKGIHFIYLYESDIPKSSFDYEGLHFDIENDGGYLLVEPSTFAGRTRKIIGNKIERMNSELKEFIFPNINKKEKSISKDESESSLIHDSDLIKGLEGCCNSRFVQVGGMFRKFMNVRQTEQALGLVNKYMLDDPMDYKSLKSMCQQIEKYHKADVDTISQEIINHMKIVSEAHVRDLKECLGYDRKDIESALKFLCDHKKLYKVKKDLYKFVEDVTWQEDFLSLGTPLPFKVPYFEDYAYFESGSLIVIGAVSGTGKSHMSVNFIKKFVEQGIYPYLISTEAGSKFSKVAQTIGLKEGDFGYYQTKNPSLVPIKEKSVTIVDWLKAPNSDYAKMDTIYEELNDKLVEKGGLMIVFAQLKKENKSFYAENMVEFFASLVAKLLFPEKEGEIDNLNPYLKTTKIRDSKINKQYLDIPLTFNTETKLLELK